MTIHHTYGPGIWLFSYDTSSATRDQGKNVHIHHNIFYNTGTNPSITWVGGIITNGFEDTVIENNVFDSIYHSAIAHMDMTGGSSTYAPAGDGYTTIVRNNIIVNTLPRTNPSIDWVGGIVASGFYDTRIENNVFDGAYHAAVTHMYPTGYSIDLSPQDTGYTTIVRNNIIVNTLPRTKEPSGTGYGVINYLPGTHTFVLENNCLYNNKAGNYKNCASTTDIYADPLFADLENHDYHLKSKAGRWNGERWVKDKVTSPCIDAGYSLSDYANEPEDNGDRINIGRYGNTIYASLSGDIPGYVVWWNQIFSPQWKNLRFLLRTIFYSFSI